MNDSILRINRNDELCAGVYEMAVAAGDNTFSAVPGQFAEIRLSGFFLRRPISVADVSDKEMIFVYKVIGGGTDAMSSMKAGDSIEVMAPLGNGYDIAKADDRPYVVGGGLGVPPMYFLTRKLIESGRKPAVILGYNTRGEMFYSDRFAKLGADVCITTADGSCGQKGFVTDAVPPDRPYVFACGPEPMLKAVYDVSADGQFSFEARMGCGFGACMGCSRRMKSGYKRICKEGPIFDREDILW
ncbi:MAG: dihydroorotate dehydrogenase electron transfer subunit [Eubacteriaceae bacterium]|nr:dihydroorotate dehydrogenase electron transfer subunit [Eubacteriaceae bacterium]